MLKNKYYALSMLVVVFLCTRIVVLLCSELLIHQGEEYYIGAVTQGIIQGWAHPLWAFQVRPYHGGSLFNAVFCVPFFLAIGPYVISVKLASISFYLFGLVMLFLTFSRHFSVKAAIFVCLLYIFCPPLLMARFFIFNGAFTETIVFSILILFFFFNLCDNPSKINYILLGVSSGFALWYSYANIMVIISYGLAWIIKEKKLSFNKLFILYALSFLAGFSPWFILNAQSGFAGVGLLKWNADNFATNTFLPGFIQGLRDLIFKDGYKIFAFDSYSLFAGKAFNAAYYAIFLTSLFFLARGNNGKKTISILMYPAVFAVIYASCVHRFEHSGWAILDYRYALPLFVFIFMIIALYIEKLFISGRPFLKRIGASLFIGLVCMGIIGNGRLIFSPDFHNRNLYEPASDYKSIGNAAFRQYGEAVDKARRIIKNIKSQYDIDDVYHGYGESLGEAGRIDDLGRYAALAAGIRPERSKKWFFFGLGEGLVKICYSGKISLKQFFSKAEEINIAGPCKHSVIQGVLSELLMRDKNKLPVEKIILETPPAYHRMLYLMYGINEGSTLCRTRERGRYDDISVRISPDYRKYFYIGTGGGVAFFFSQEKSKIINFFSGFDDPIRAFLLEGVGLYYYKLHGLDREEFDANLPFEWKEYSERLIEGADAFDAAYEH